MVRKYENTHCGINGIGTSPLIPLMPIKNKYLDKSKSKNNNKFDRETQKADKDISKFFVKK